MSDDNRQRYKRSITVAMDSDSDVPLSNLASMDYLRREIVKLEKLVAEKTARMQPSATSPAAHARRLLPRIPMAGSVYSSATAIPSSAVEKRELRRLGRRSSSNREGASGAAQTDAPERSSGCSGTTARELETRTLNLGRENDERLRERNQPEP